MLYRSDFYACSENFDTYESEIAVKIQGAMMKHIPTDYAEKLHISGYHPYSIYVFEYGNGYIIRASALNEEAKLILDAMSDIKKIKLFGLNKTLNITDVKPYEPLNINNLENVIAGNRCRMELVTPAMFKTKGSPSNMPDIHKYFYSVILKYNTFENDTLDYDEFLSAFNTSRLTAYELKSVKYNVSGHIFPGMTGFFDVTFPADTQMSSLLKKVFVYASYCGIGGKTGMGMGGVTLEHVNFM